MEKWLIGTALMIGISIAIWAIFFNENSRQTDTYSWFFNNQQAKIDFLKKYVICQSDILATEFHIVYNDATTGLLPSSPEWNIQVAVKVLPLSINKWLAGFIKVPELDTELTILEDIISESDLWERTSIPSYYKRPEANDYLIVYESEGIILKKTYS